MTISEKTGISIGLMVLIGSGIASITSIYIKTEANAASLKEYTETLRRIDRRLYRIEGRLQIENKEE